MTHKQVHTVACNNNVLYSVHVLHSVVLRTVSMYGTLVTVRKSKAVTGSRCIHISLLHGLKSDALETSLKCTNQITLSASV